ncbi:hypothetical protein SAMN02745220_04120 [Desulfopila aestuarii DSM 18488]|uniref:Uncharacterized protein n=1 Tax=Desulfopila aestuarii DSM 18488 TaxID=1121416 RepID=A0A1M7YGF0_9BACT|nr:hypothetical protein SAMN02745220_04120 [Desulfopila aestuarii DSM 18488]
MNVSQYSSEFTTHEGLEVSGYLKVDLATSTCTLLILAHYSNVNIYSFLYIQKE